MLDDDKLQQSFVWFRLSVLMQHISQQQGLAWSKYIVLVPITHADQFIDMVSERYKEVGNLPFSGADIGFMITKFKVPHQCTLFSF